MEQPIFILTPRGRDAAVIEQVLQRSGTISQTCRDLMHLRACLDERAGAVIITEEVLAGKDLEALIGWFHEQPPWSDIPVITLTTKQVGRRSDQQAMVLERLGNVVLLERPINAETLTSAVRSALRGRRRQYQARELLLEKEQSEARFKGITDSIDQMIWSTLPDGYHDYYNQRWYDYTGVPEGTTDGEAWAGMFHPDDREHAWTSWRSSLATGEPYFMEYRLRHRSGQYRWVLGRAQPVRGDDGRIVRWFGTCTDIEEIVEAREVLARSREELASIVEKRTAERDRLWTLAEDLLARADYEGGLTAVNPAWARVLGWSEHQLLTNPYAEIIHPEDVESTVAALASMSETGQPTRFENRIRASTGGWKPIGWTVSPEPDGLQFIAIGRDMTDEKAREQELEQAQDQLRQAQKMEAVGQLTGGIAHDFNNLLQIVTGNLDMLQRNLPEDAARLRRAATNAMTGATRAAALTHRLLAFSRRQPLDPKAISVNDLLSGMSDLLGRTLGETIEIKIVLAEGLWPVETDPNQLENAILNLAVNARDAMPVGGKLTIETANGHLDNAYARHHAEVQAGQYVVLCVSDTGIGMDPAIVAKAFEPFFTTKEVGKGTGLGLSQVYGFVRQSGGHVKVYSEPGEGTTVRIYLPRLVGYVPEAEAKAETVVPEGMRSETVLVLEDDDEVRAYSVEVLRELGYRVLEAHDGQSALRLLERQNGNVDLLFSDIVLPGGMTGAVVAKRARDMLPGLRVLFTTGYARDAIVHKGRLDAGVQLLTKPFTYGDLAAKVRDVLDS